MTLTAHENAAFENGEGLKDLEKQASPTMKSDEVIIEDKPKSDMLFGVDDVPPWDLSILLGVQHYLTMVGSTISIPFILTPLLCIADDNPVRGTFISSIIFVSGIATLLQTTLGVRLPIIQGGTFAFLVPTVAILTNSFPTCDTYNFSNMTEDATREVWQVRIREIQGDIMVASLVQVLIGFTGIIGFFLRWITPLVIAPTITLIGLALFDVAAQKSSGHWGLAILTMAILTIFSQYLTECNVPVPRISNRRLTTAKLKIFKLFPVLLALVFCWLFCVILTVTNALPENSPGRTDTKLNILMDSPWFYVPYPFQFGIPTVSGAGILGIIAGVIASMIESVGDYYAAARLSEAPPPPTHAINRGIGFEGIGCVVAGLIGTGNGTTSYSENIGAIQVTKVGSRAVVQVGAFVMILFGMFSKFGALFVTLPEPIVGGMFFVMFSMITAVGISNVQYVNMNSSRNLFVLGFSLFFGLSVPKWLHNNPGAINTGVTSLDQIITVLLSTSMFVGGVLAIIFDNTIPGTREDRGLDKWNSCTNADEPDSKPVITYDLPLVMKFLRRKKWSRKLPFSPTYKEK